MNRQPVVAGRFYPDSPAQLREELKIFMGKPEADADRPVDRLVMVPHAGYVFSGEPCGKTLAQSKLASTVLLMGPNHTGLGSPLSVWDTGSWEFPGGSLDVDEKLAAELIASGAGFTSNEKAHSREHSLEVVVPFLHYLDPGTKIVPICVSESSPANLHQAGEVLAKIISEYPEPVSMVVSSDMSHFISADQAKKLDSMALEAIIRMDPSDFYSIVASNQISMCGVLPMTMAMFAAKILGANSGKLVDYTNSGKATGDYERVVAYAGVIIS
ncbi:AmmeMemoRadiSam system protein B [Maridesulfovibrio sp.]|jgi:AmmeMemoRadiSam system protein B|uniref:AmmeMemoRadiSam system protein B n=1 Tax=Maridesulfovibrio sp. TaxID=2795000 RepID=UPI0029CA90DC|nr:AmmeMemoRadiSam system protein B [Maridesulfovibrio sp.]